MIRASIFALTLLATGVCLAADSSAAPLRVGIIGLQHGHVAGFLNGGALTPAGGASHRPDIQVVGIVETDQALFDKYAVVFIGQQACTIRASKNWLRAHIQTQR